jgi:hypothetical protein
MKCTTPLKRGPESGFLVSLGRQTSLPPTLIHCTSSEELDPDPALFAPEDARSFHARSCSLSRASCLAPSARPAADSQHAHPRRVPLQKASRQKGAARTRELTYGVDSSRWRLAHALPLL